MEKEGRKGIKRKFIKRIRWSGQEWNRNVYGRQEDETENEIKRKLKDIQIQEWNEAIEKCF